MSVSGMMSVRLILFVHLSLTLYLSACDIASALPRRCICPCPTWHLPVFDRPVPVFRQVHSLTARSVSREFREGLKLGAPVSLHSGNIRDPGLLSCRRPAADCGVQQRQPPEPQEGDVELAPGLRLVASRAAFWDRKVAQELS